MWNDADWLSPSSFADFYSVSWVNVVSSSSSSTMMLLSLRMSSSTLLEFLPNTAFWPGSCLAKAAFVETKFEKLSVSSMPGDG